VGSYRKEFAMSNSAMKNESSNSGEPSILVGATVVLVAVALFEVVLAVVVKAIQHVL
jgi:hypothetical protein